MTNELLVKDIRLSTVLGGDTRLEASTYLRDGYGFVRLANQCDNHERLGDLADIWQPNRLTGYTVAEGMGLLPPARLSDDDSARRRYSFHALPIA